MNKSEFIVAVFKTVEGNEKRIADVVLREAPFLGQNLEGYGYVKTLSQPFLIGKNLSENEPISGFKAVVE